MRPGSILLFLAAGGCWYLIEVDRRTPWALDLVELQSDVPVPIWALLAGLGLLLFLGGGKTRARAASKSPRSRPRDSPAEPERPDIETDWYRSAIARSQKETWEHGVHMSWGPLPDIDVMLVLQSATPARFKRSVRAFLELIAGLPRPRRIRIQLRNCDTEGLNVAQEVQACCYKHWQRGQVRVMAMGNEVDIFFQQPEPGWPG
jgi:hypothetical protein